MKTIRINDLARDMGMRSRQVLDVLVELGISSRKSHSSSLKEDEAAKIRAFFQRGAEATSGGDQRHLSHSPAPSASISPTTEPSHISQSTVNIRQAYIKAGLITPAQQVLETTGVPTSPASKPKVIIGRSTGRHSAKSQKSICPVCLCNMNSKKLPRREEITCEACKRHVEKKKQRRRIEKTPGKYSSRLNAPISRTMPISHAITFAIPAQQLQPQSYEEVRIPCSECGLMVKPDAMELHIANLHSKEQNPQLHGLPTTSLSFVVLPPGTRDFRQWFEDQLRRSRRHPHGFFEQEFDWNRIAQIESLNPVRLHAGTESWFGYCVYEFSFSDRVVLECPLERNATYILSGNWKEMIPQTKADVRRKYGDRCVRKFHKGNWLDRVRNALGVRKSSKRACVVYAGKGGQPFKK